MLVEHVLSVVFAGSWPSTIDDFVEFAKQRIAGGA